MPAVDPVSRGSSETHAPWLDRTAFVFMEPMERLATAVNELCETLQSLPATELTDMEIQILNVLEAALNRRAKVRARAALIAWKNSSPIPQDIDN